MCSSFRRRLMWMFIQVNRAGVTLLCACRFKGWQIHRVSCVIEVGRGFTPHHPHSFWPIITILIESGGKNISSSLSHAAINLLRWRGAAITRFDARRRAIRIQMMWGCRRDYYFRLIPVFPLSLVSICVQLDTHTHSCRVSGNNNNNWDYTAGL